METYICPKCNVGFCDCEIKDGNLKVDNGKLRHDLLPLPAAEDTILAFMDGIKEGKYKPFDWLENPTEWHRYYNAAKRHIDAFWSGEANAKDSGVNHIGHAIASLMILHTYHNKGVGTDDRQK